MAVTLTAQERRLRELARKHGTPLMLISRSVLRDQLQRFRDALPRVEPFFAIKANAHPEIIKAMVAGRASFDVASVAEMNLVLAAGAKPAQVIFANTVKPEASIALAAKKGVTLMTFDSEYELAKIAEHAPGARVLVRIKVPNVGSIVELSLKFGVDPADATSLMIKAYKLGLQPAGVSFHVGSQCLRVENYIEALEMAAIIARDARLKQLPFEIVDIGGGFPIRHFDHEEDPFGRLASVLKSELDRLFDPAIRIIAEPGRFIVGPAATLLMRVIGKAIRENKLWYYLDDGLYGSLSGQVFDHCKYEFKYLRGGHTQLSTLAGPTCDSFDIIARGEDAPELQLGDVVYVENIGAYSLASATTFNGMPTAKVVMTP
ncbi:MAG: type III PLP-dependent enzyme [Candidatus Anammoximicrobium sp.]|nr:type III PLP-dependent enzyme [Candidatus Anammoximicrobium sp.]